MQAMGSTRTSQVAALAFFALASAACAEVPEPLDRFSLSLGGFYPIVDAKVSANGPEVAGTDVDFERDLGLDKHRTLPNVRLEILVLDSQGFSIGGYQYSKSARATLTRDIMFDGNDYNINAFVEAGLRLYTYNAAWHWWFAPVPSDVIGIGLGAAYYDLKGTIDGGLSVNEHSASAHGEAEGSAVAPLLMLAWKHAFSTDLRGYLDFAGVRKSSGSVTGHLLNATVGMEYYPFHNVGLALEYSSNALDLKAERESWTGRASIHFHGPAAFVRMRF
jgi:hypothetical protein